MVDAGLLAAVLRVDEAGVMRDGDLLGTHHRDLRGIEIEASSAPTRDDARHLAPLMVVFVSALTLSACGGGAEGNGGRSAETATPSEATQEPAAPTAAERDGAIADAGVLTLRDVLLRWRSGKRVPLPAGSGCEAFDQVVDSASELARSRRFRDPRGVASVSNVVFVFGDDAAAKRGFDTFVGDETRRCLGNVFRGQFNAIAKRFRVEVTGFSQREIAIEPIGSDSRALVWKTNIAQSGKHYTVIVQHSLVRVGRALTAMSTRTLGPPRQSVLRDMLGASVRRIENALNAEERSPGAFGARSSMKSTTGPTPVRSRAPISVLWR